MALDLGSRITLVQIQSGRPNFGAGVVMIIARYLVKIEDGVSNPGPEPILRCKDPAVQDMPEYCTARNRALLGLVWHSAIQCHILGGSVNSASILRSRSLE